MFASKTTRTVPLPSDPSITVTIGKLSWLQRQDARNVSQRASMKALAEMGGPSALKAFQVDAPENAAPVAPDPFLLHDTLTVLVCGVKAWSAPEPVNKETLADLGEDDAEGLARAILDLSLPSPTLDADRKNAE
jgi:hypothetical protein